MHEEIWPKLLLFSGASVLGIAKITQEPKKWYFNDGSESSWMRGRRGLLVGV